VEVWEHLSEGRDDEIGTEPDTGPDGGSDAEHGTADAEREAPTADTGGT
jgi:hypothetical protein